MRTYTESDLNTVAKSGVNADLDRVPNIRQDEIDHYLDVARRMRAAAIADLFRKAGGAVTRILHLTPASRGATPRAV